MVDKVALKRQAGIFVLAMLVCVIANLISLPALSDDGDEPDGRNRLGLPFLIYESGLGVDDDYFSHAALWGDIGIALAASTLAAKYCERMLRAKPSAGGGRFHFPGRR
jgi:hypothetical protein